MQETEIRVLWEYAAQAWPNYTIPTTPEQRRIRIEVWSDMLGDLEAGLVRAALGSLSGREFFPPLGIVRDTAALLQNQIDGVPSVPDVDQAWDEVTWALQHVGRREPPQWTHPAIAATVRALNWNEICNCGELGVMRGQFARLYETCKGRVERERVPPPPALAAFIANGLKRVDDVLEIGPGSDGH